jgi:hypothetical protein
MQHGPANFCSIVVKPYYTKEVPEDDQPEDNTKPTTENTELTAKNTKPTARNEL